MIGSAQPSSLDIITLVIAVLGLALAIAGFVWQLVTWRYEGAKIRVALSTVFPVHGDQLGDPHHCVTATNVGRSPVSLTNWGFELPDGGSTYMRRPLPISTPLPHTLDGGQQASFHCAYKELRASLHRSVPAGVVLRPYVSTALHGKVYAKQQLTVEPSP